MGFKDIVRTKLQKFIKDTDTGKSTEQMPGGEGGGLNRFMNRMAKSYFDSLTEQTKRANKYKEYRYLDKNLAEASSALNIYADNIVSGAREGEENYRVAVPENISDAITDVITKTERETQIKDSIWDISRDLIRDGDDWEEVVIAERNKEFFVQKLKRLPPETMYADIDEKGVWNNPDYHYIQKATAFDSAGVPFENWRVIHFKVGRGIYGVDRSLFANASRRIGRQLLWMNDSMVLARLSRAYNRYAFLVDTSGLNLADKFEFAEKFLERIRRKEIVDRTSGRISPLDAPWLPDEDIAIPVEKDSPQDVRVLSGDLNMGRIDDVKYFQEEFFMALNMPKAYASKEEGVKAKATMTQLDVQFARQVRRKQQTLKPGLKQLYTTAFHLAGIDPESFKWSIIFPPLATMDELLKWQVEKVKGEVAKLYTIDVGVLNDLWIMEVLLGFDRKQIEKYSSRPMPPVGERGDYPHISPDTAAMIRKDPYLRGVLDDLKDMVSWKISHEEEIENKRLVGIEREERLKDKDNY